MRQGAPPHAVLCLSYALRAAYDALLQKLAAAGCPLRYEAIPARCGPNHLELADIDAAVQLSLIHI